MQVLVSLHRALLCWLPHMHSQIRCNMNMDAVRPEYEQLVDLLAGLMPPGEMLMRTEAAASFGI